MLKVLYVPFFELVLRHTTFLMDRVGNVVNNIKWHFSSYIALYHIATLTDRIDFMANYS